ncbi:hypothetical protein [Inhella crocodyli]|uniref:Siroheme decarboxylase NirL-like HTH domain-containing protein n=1 Tax=Inhella crocodyli TaxID=2499851 RepID=A0A437LTW6_9BURK|nr:hypothetical protein [Inhella crocodyli]RVT88703.1 hypothetical protein EOD73_06975 [Inhella crocodyli]
MAHAPTAPSCCAGLRPALLNGWRACFPVHPSPFHQVAAQCGGTWREVLQQCQRLHHSGGLQALQARWGHALQRVHWRLGLRPAASDRQRAARALAAHPACVRLTHWQGQDPGPAAPPTLWVDLVGRDSAALAATVDAWRDAGWVDAQVQRLVLREPDRPCDCAQSEGPCADAELAHALEAGLPLVAHPYGALAAQLQRPERRVLARLQRWQRQGQLGAMALSGPWSAATLTGAAALLRDAALDADRLRALRAQPGVSEVHVLPPAPLQPGGLWVAVQAPHDRALAVLRAALSGWGTVSPPAVLGLTHTTLPRAAPALFSHAA